MDPQSQIGFPTQSVHCSVAVSTRGITFRTGRITHVRGFNERAFLQLQHVTRTGKCYIIANIFLFITHISWSTILNNVFNTFNDRKTYHQPHYRSVHMSFTNIIKGSSEFFF